MGLVSNVAGHASLSFALALSASCVTASAGPDRPRPVPARATFALGFITRIELTMPEGYPLVIQPAGLNFAIGQQPIVRAMRDRPQEKGVLIEWPSDSRETWDGDEGQLFISKLEGVQTGVPADWVGSIAGHLLARLVHRGDPVGRERYRTLDLDFAGGVFNAGESTSGY